MLGYSLYRGMVRASWFDLNIAARRLENVASMDINMLPDNREKMLAQAARIRSEATKILNTLTPSEQRQMQTAADRVNGKAEATKSV